MFYTAIEALTIGILSANAPYGTTYTSPAPPLFATPFVTAATGQNGGQYFPVQLAPLNTTARHPDPNVDWSQFEPISGIPAYPNTNKIPYTEEYMLSIQRGFGNNTVLDVSYVGTQAHHLLVLEEANPGNPALCLQLSNPANLAPGQTPCGPFGESNVFTTASGQVINGTRGPLGPNFGSDTQPDHHRQFQLQLSASNIATHQRSAAVAGGLHIQQIAGPILQSGRRGQSAQSFAQQGLVRLRYHAQLCGELQLPDPSPTPSARHQPLDPRVGILRNHALQQRSAGDAHQLRRQLAARRGAKRDQ